MPQLVKGGKNAYAWSKVHKNGRIVIPKDALTEYGLDAVNKIILITASKTSGGFSITSTSLLKNSKLSVILDKEPILAEFSLPEGETIKIATKTYCWVKLNKKGEFTVPVETLAKYEVRPGDHLLSVRGSCVGLSFIVKGPIIEEAKKHSELCVLE
jgi:bifunctional DNA-binding transcriptional regulator/antitoxin component of YhaV-PrlF toxin-antitoxin module